MTSQTIGQYRIVRQLGEGGMGVVYEGINDSLQKRVAIKVLHAEFSQNAQVRQRFFNEARAVNMVQHPGLVSVLEVGQNPDGCMYLVMEFLAGESLRSRLQRQNGPLPLRTAVRLLRQMALALAAAHQKRIVHRDLKPDNVMIVIDTDVPGGERAKLLDFGIAKIIDDAPPTENGMRTRTGMMMGTPAYMAPEQCRGAGSVDEKADAYSIGVMAFEMLCGQKPFSGAGPGELIGRHLFEPPPALQSLAPSVPQPVANLVHRLLAKLPAERPTMPQLAQELEALRFSEEALPIPGWSSAAPPVASSGGSPNRTLPLSLATLGDATAQHGGTSTGRRGRRGWIAGGIAAVMLVGVTAGVLRIRSPVDVEGPPTRRPTPRPAAGPLGDAPKPGPAGKPLPVTTHWEVTSAPPGAAILQASDLAEEGHSPWQKDTIAEVGDSRYIVRLGSYQDQDITLDHNRSQILHIQLKPVAKLPTSPEIKKPKASGAATRASIGTSPTNAATTKPAGSASPKVPAKPRLKTDEELEMFK